MNFSNLLRRKSIEAIQRDADLGVSDHEVVGEPHLRKTLGVGDLTAFGIAAIIGAGIFSTIGNASFNGGPAVSLLFVFTAIACAFSALCYAEFAASIPVAGSAYTYAYASFGELIAWIIGWDLLLEYAIGNIAVAISWSGYFTGLIAGWGIHVPEFLTMDYLSASRGFAANAEKVQGLLAQGQTIETLRTLPDAISGSALDAYLAWTNAPRIGGMRMICDLPALGIVLLISMLVYVGIRESKRAANIMVAVKVAVVLLVIGVGAFYVKPSNWSPFAPNGIAGVLKGVSAVFFAYIGFDAISTTAEECKNPKRDLPLGMILSLIICTVLYILVALVLTGMTSYKLLAVDDPLAYVFGTAGANVAWMHGIIAVSAVVAMATVLLVFQLGQPRIWMAMSRDGLLPKIFSSIHPRFKTPWFATIVAGLVVAIPSLFMNLTEVTDLTSIGTLFAFVLVCGGVLILNAGDVKQKRKYVPYINSRFIIPVLFVVTCVLLYRFKYGSMATFFSFSDPADASIGAWGVFKHKIPTYGFILFSIILTALCAAKQLSLIPVLGLLSCGYLISELGITNWTRFLVWLAVGLVVYVLYGYRHSHLAQKETA